MKNFWYWVFQCTLIIACLSWIAWLSKPALSAELEKYEQRLFMVNPKITFIITNQPCHVPEIVQTFDLPQEQVLFAYARRVDDNDKVEFIGGCYTQLVKPNRYIIKWTNGNMISVPTENFQDVTEI